MSNWLTEVPVPSDITSIQSLSELEELVSVWGVVTLQFGLRSLEVFGSYRLLALAPGNTCQKEVSVHHLFVPGIQVKSVALPAVVPVSDKFNTVAGNAKKGSHDSVGHQPFEGNRHLVG